MDLPAEEVPPEMPEPALGINFARDGMQRKVPISQAWGGALHCTLTAWRTPSCLEK